MEALRIEYRRSKWEIPADFLQFSHFQRVVEDMDMSSSTGYPYLTMYSSNRDFFGDVEGVKDENRLWAIYRMVTEQIRLRVADPIRLFIKPEPHKVSKIEKRAFRLISSVSVIDQIIDHMLFDDFNFKIQDNHVYQVPQIGWAPIKQGWMHMPTQGVAMDKSGWDWTVRPWLLQMVLELRKSTCVNLVKEWEDLATWRYQQLFANPMFVTSGGHLLQQKQPGVMKSGCVNTITDNSIMQDILNKVVEIRTGICSSWMMTMGDDTLQAHPGDVDGYISELKKYCLVKDVVYGVEFAGFRFKLNHVEPLYTAKHCFNLLHLEQPVAAETAAAYALLYHRSEKASLIKYIAGQVTELPSNDWLDEIWDGESD